MHPADSGEKRDRSLSIPTERVWQENKKCITANSTIHKEKKIPKDTSDQDKAAFFDPFSPETHL